MAKALRPTLQHRKSLRESNPPLTLWARKQINKIGLNPNNYLADDNINIFAHE